MTSRTFRIEAYTQQIVDRLDSDMQNGVEPGKSMAVLRVRMVSKGGYDVTRMSVWTVWLALIDCVVFIAIWAFNRVQAARAVHIPWYGHALYFAAALCGFGLAIWGFIALTRGGQLQLRRASACVLLSMVPGCAALIFLLSHLNA